MWLLLFGMLLTKGYAQIGPPPIIVVPPLSQTVLRGGTATFIVIAASGTTLSYQWYADTLLIPAQPLDGQTSSTLTLTNVSTADNGQYYAEVKNAGGKTTSSKATLVVLNKPPVANNDTYSMSEEASLTIPAPGVLGNDTDEDGDALRVLLQKDVSNGSLNLNSDGSFTYIPNTNYCGSDSFTYRVSDGLNRAVSLLEQNISGGNTIEVRNTKPGAQSFRHGSAGGYAYSVSKVSLRLSRKSSAPNRSLNFSIGTGINSDAIAGSSFAIEMASVTNTSGGSSFQDYVIAYATPVGPFDAGTTYYLNFENGPNGRDVFVEMSGNDAYADGTYFEGGDKRNEDMRFKVYGIIDSDIATVSITVAPVNDIPVANNDTYTTKEDAPLRVRPSASILNNDVDADGDALTPELVSDAVRGSLSFNPDGSFTYTPNSDFFGSDSFTYRLTDGLATGNIATVTIVVEPIDDPLRITSQQMTANGFELQISGPASSTYIISASANLSDWTPVFTDYTDFGNMTFTDTGATNTPVRFYRVEAR
jgi:Big-like domain-containing protein/Ig-like domain-containing protein